VPFLRVVQPDLSLDLKASRSCRAAPKYAPKGDPVQVEDHHLSAQVVHYGHPREALGDVSRSSIGNTVREIRPLLAEAGLLPSPASTRYRSAADLLTAAQNEGATPTG